MLSITRQQQWDLSKYEKELFQNRREQLKLQVKDNHLTGISRIYENQIKAGQKICDCFDELHCLTLFPNYYTLHNIF